MAKAATGLQAAVDDADSAPGKIKESLTAYRKAREAVRQELAMAQEQLREVLTVRQEAYLVLGGTLD
jgi:hypothetical protein